MTPLVYTHLVSSLGVYDTISEACYGSGRGVGCSTSTFRGSSPKVALFVTPKTDVDER